MRSTKAASPRTVAAGAALLALAAFGCGDSKLVLVVDVASYMSEEEKTFEYSSIPPHITEAVQTFGPDTLSFSEGLTDMAEVRETTVTLEMEIANETGSGTVEIYIYMSSLDEDPFQTEPLAQMHFDLAPGSSDTARAVMGADTRIGELLLEPEVLLAEKLEFNTVNSDDFLKGQARILDLKLKVVSKRIGL